MALDPFKTALGVIIGIVVLVLFSSIGFPSVSNDLTGEVIEAEATAEPEDIEFVSADSQLSGNTLTISVTVENNGGAGTAYIKNEIDGTNLNCYTSDDLAANTQATLSCEIEGADSAETLTVFVNKEEHTVSLK
jgi:hypothetical protein